MSTRKEKLLAILEKTGHSNTKPRQLIFEILSNQKPISINELIKKVGDSMDRVSVYRTVELFEKIGIIQRVNIGWKYKIELADKFIEHHHHLVCLNCRNIVDINEQSLESLIDKIAEQYDYKIENHQIELQGYCIKCSK